MNDLSTVAGICARSRSLSGDGGPAISATFQNILGLALNSSGDLYIGSDAGNYRIRRISRRHNHHHVAGNNPTALQSGYGLPNRNSPELDSPQSMVAELPRGSLYFAEFGRQRRPQDRERCNYHSSGRGERSCRRGWWPRQPVTALAGPIGLAVDKQGNLYISEWFSSTVRKVSNGIITTVAGTGTRGFSGDGGPATDAMLTVPEGVAVDASGNLYIADTGNLRIRKVTQGVISTIAGTGIAGHSDDGVLAINAQLGFPQKLALDSSDNLFFTDGTSRPASNLFFTDGTSVRSIRNGVINTVVGNGTSGFGGDGGPATSALLDGVTGFTSDAAGNMYIADGNNQRIRRVSGGIITTVAGNEVGGFAELTITGPAEQAELNSPYDVAVDTTGKVYISDYRNNLIRLLTPDPRPAITTDGVVP